METETRTKAEASAEAEANGGCGRKRADEGLGLLRTLTRFFFNLRLFDTFELKKT
ncbi:MAG: hypothetical protein JSV20_05625 [Candidatus Bathyarchaeota archaeon]|nr:MAG: hypothetical protein JSV20_05625 [Candidatus Bathyarchaeota archaeon]